MGNLRIVKLATGFVCVSALMLLTAAPALAHQEKELGDYTVEVGFAVEPAFQNQMNGVELFAETKDGKKVEGLEKTIKFEISAGGKTRMIDVHPVFDDPGHYVGEFMPTLVGDYVFHMTGKLGDLDVDEKFESGPGRFSAVMPISDAQFPVQYPSPDEVSAAVTAAEIKASQAQTFGVIGIAAGVIGILLGGVALLRRRA
jgi:hypothetical protein